MHLKERCCRDVPVDDLTLVADWSHVARLSFCQSYRAFLLQLEELKRKIFSLRNLKQEKDLLTKEL